MINEYFYKISTLKVKLPFHQLLNAHSPAAAFNSNKIKTRGKGPYIKSLLRRRKRKSYL